MQRVNELRKQGMWSNRRLPKVQEPARSKAHWDYLLEEMQWLATDFAQERKWKKAGARKVIVRYIRDLKTVFRHSNCFFVPESNHPGIVRLLGWMRIEGKSNIVMHCSP